MGQSHVRKYKGLKPRRPGPGLPAKETEAWLSVSPAQRDAGGQSSSFKLGIQFHPYLATWKLCEIRKLWPIQYFPRCWKEDLHSQPLSLRTLQKFAFIEFEEQQKYQVTQRPCFFISTVSKRGPDIWPSYIMQEASLRTLLNIGDPTPPPHFLRSNKHVSWLLCLGNEPQVNDKFSVWLGFSSGITRIKYRQQFTLY